MRVCERAGCVCEYVGVWTCVVAWVDMICVGYVCVRYIRGTYLVWEGVHVSMRVRTGYVHVYMWIGVY